MGAPYMDYIIADRILIREGEEKFYTEKVVTLPDSLYRVNLIGAAPLRSAAPGRAACGLPQTGFVFCSFNSSYKLTPEVFAGWMNILTAVPQSVLWLLENNPDFAGNLRREAAAAGIAAERLVFAPVALLDQHLARMSQADLFLDLLPCGRSHHCQRRLVGGGAAGHLPRACFRRPGGGQPVERGGIARTDHGKSERVPGPLALGLAGNPVRLKALRQKKAGTESADRAAVRYRPFLHLYRGGFHHDG